MHLKPATISRDAHANGWNPTARFLHACLDGCHGVGHGCAPRPCFGSGTSRPPPPPLEPDSPAGAAFDAPTAGPDDRSSTVGNVHHGAVPAPGEQADNAVQHISISVYSCGRAGSHGASQTELKKSVSKMQRDVARFYREQSNGKVDLRFVEGTAFAVPSEQLKDENLYDLVFENKGRFGTCESALVNDMKVDRDYILLMDIPVSERFRWFWEDGGGGIAQMNDGRRRIVMVTQDRFRAGNCNNGNFWDQFRPSKWYSAEQHFLTIVAHEIGHAYFHWSHPWDYEPELDDSHSMEGLMSYCRKGGKVDLRQNAHVVCHHKIISGWISPSADCPLPRLNRPLPPAIQQVLPRSGGFTVVWWQPNAVDNSNITGFRISCTRTGTQRTRQEIRWRWVTNNYCITTVSYAQARAAARANVASDQGNFAATIFGLDNATTYEVAVQAIGKGGAYSSDTSAWYSADAQAWLQGHYSFLSPSWKVNPRAPRCPTVVDDEPALGDRLGGYTWFEPPAWASQSGHGRNGFRFTLAVGNSSAAEFDNWAEWDFGSVTGECQLQAWVPAHWATAHVRYDIFVDNKYIRSRWLDQARTAGRWGDLGTWDLNGHVKVRVYDTTTQDDYRDVGASSARLAADALRLLPK